MIYTEKTILAVNLMVEKHAGQKDKAGIPYCFHPWTVAESMETEDSCIAALLHDVLEDTDITMEELRTYGFSEEVYEALALLTHDPAVPYMDYVKALSGNDIARAVKISDLHHNMDLSRMNGKKPRKYALYQEALDYLLNCTKK